MDIDFIALKQIVAEELAPKIVDAKIAAGVTVGNGVGYLSNDFVQSAAAWLSLAILAAILAGRTLDVAIKYKELKKDG